MLIMTMLVPFLVSSEVFMVTFEDHRGKLLIKVIAHTIQFGET